MSLYHENFVWPLDMPGLKKIVLCYVAREAGLKSGEASLTIREIAYRCGISDSAVRTYLKELEQTSLLTRLPGPGKTVVLRVNLGEAACSA
ncbi:helix-turn-helix domain-containing protein [Burkholderia sp. Ax-1719]|uniref:MarR family transcriptional regulator n=1 Tax=Burkholderia sp. Ax-1719 TaxID=2608334 RepID=UPI001422B3B5|nr:helix-turn-helix domain-containing protein [Burkholderia sp. Ax-1719]NIE67451.1 MarR family transcriptional regulator [Burkholderia sp. Ax-1719]